MASRIYVVHHSIQWFRVSFHVFLACFLSFSRSAGWFFCCFYLFGDQSVNTSWRVHFVCCSRALSLIIKLTPISFCVLLCNNIGFARDAAKFMGNLISFVVCSFVCLLKISLFVFIGVCSECHFPSWSALKLMSRFRLYIFFLSANVTSKIEVDGKVTADNNKPTWNLLHSFEEEQKN